MGPDLFTQELWFLLKQFEKAENYGSLLRPQVKNPEQIWDRLQELGVFDDMFLRITNEKVKKIIKFSEYLAPKFHIVISNPPYMNSGKMNSSLLKLGRDAFPTSKSNLYSMFIERNLEFSQTIGVVGMITLESWMFRSTYDKFRKNLLHKTKLETMAHLGTGAFDSISGEVVSTTAFVLSNLDNHDLQGKYIRLVSGKKRSRKGKNTSGKY